MNLPAYTDEATKEAYASLYAYPECARQARVEALGGEEALQNWVHTEIQNWKFGLSSYPEAMRRLVLNGLKVVNDHVHWSNVYQALQTESMPDKERDPLDDDVTRAICMVFEGMEWKELANASGSPQEVEADLQNWMLDTITEWAEFPDVQFTSGNMRIALDVMLEKWEHSVDWAKVKSEMLTHVRA